MGVPGAAARRAEDRCEGVQPLAARRRNLQTRPLGHGANREDGCFSSSRGSRGTLSSAGLSGTIFSLDRFLATLAAAVSVLDYTGADTRSVDRWDAFDNRDTIAVIVRAERARERQSDGRKSRGYHRA